MKYLKYSVVLLFLLVFCYEANSQVRIRMEESGGTFKAPCSINGLNLKFTLDTGASFVTISDQISDLLEANGFLTENDIVGVKTLQIANGSSIHTIKKFQLLKTMF